jgi:glycosyltransferase involved in cell wall biosynthesis
VRIAILSTPAWRTPPRHYGPYECIASLLTEGLVKRGFDVTLYATSDSITNANLRAICSKGYEEDKTLDRKVCEALHISEIFEDASKYDLIHNNLDFLPLTYSGLVSTPMLTTIHGFTSSVIIPVYEKYNESAYYVAISNASKLSSLKYVATVYHGISLEQFTYQPLGGDYLLFFARIHPDKGTKEAIEIARRARRKLIIAGLIHDYEYFQRWVEPSIDNHLVHYVGSVGPKVRNCLMGGAYALLHPINFEEPFGLSVIESLACGTPVIAFSRGSMPEILRHGYNGFLVSDTDAAVEVIQKVPSVNRNDCRKTVKKSFTDDIMVNNYIKTYQKILDHKSNSSM